MLIVVQQVTIVLVGFSICAAAVLLFAYLFFLPDMRKTYISRLSCAALLISLAGLQAEHLRFLQTGADLFDSRFYVACLLMAPPTFYFFSREVLLPDSPRSPLLLVHFVPLLASLVVPTGFIAPVAFVIGAGYAIWFARFVYGMREQRKRFHIEMFFFGLFTLMAVCVVLLGLSMPYVDPSAFYLGYAILTGIALLLVVAALLIFPELSTDISDAARSAYANSTLGGIDIDARIRVLERLMSDDRIYENENLNLGILAEAVELGPHQLSELVNTHFGVGFSRYVRRHRVEAAKAMLIDDPAASVLSVGLSVGFKSQSNFYAAFREMTGQSPGDFRKRRAGAGAAS